MANRFHCLKQYLLKKDFALEHLTQKVISWSLLLEPLPYYLGFSFFSMNQLFFFFFLCLATIHSPKMTS